MLVRDSFAYVDLVDGMKCYHHSIDAYLHGFMSICIYPNRMPQSSTCRKANPFEGTTLEGHLVGLEHFSADNTLSAYRYTQVDRSRPCCTSVV